MKIKDTFKDLKNTLKMELGKIKIDNIAVDIQSPEFKEFNASSKATIKNIQYSLKTNIIKYQAKPTKIKKMPSPKSNIKVKNMQLVSTLPSIENFHIAIKTSKTKDIYFNFSFSILKFKDFLEKTEINSENMELSNNIKSKRIEINTHFENIMTQISKKVKVKRLKHSLNLPIIKNPIKRNLVNFIYVFEGKKYLENLGYKYSDLIFLNYFDMIPMDLVKKIVIEKNVLKIYYKKGRPQNFIDVVTFEDKKSKKLLLAPVKNKSVNGKNELPHLQK